PAGAVVIAVGADDYLMPEQDASLAGGLIIALAPDEYLIAGMGLTVVFAPNSPGDPFVGIASIQEGIYERGRWLPGLRLNGDQSHQGRHVRLPAGRFSIQRVKLYR